MLRSKSLRYILFRARFMVEQKSCLLKRKFPTELKSVKIPLLTDWRAQKDSYFFDSRECLRFQKVKDGWLEDALNHILKGDVLFFSKTWKSLGHDYDWLTNPDTGYKYDRLQHWTKIESLSQEAGDIKFVWEKSRFSWLLTICRYDYHYDEDHSKFVISQILDWIDKNPLNCGPNYKCSQETSLRMLNWLFALNFYKHSEYLTDERWQRIMTSIYWQTDHVYKNINYSRIAVRNNHAITETLTLYLMGLMFPMMPGAAKWKENGKKWFEQEIDYQIEDDGTFIQDSMNYHRVVIQLLTYAIALSDRQGETFSDFVYDKAYKSLNFLYQCQEPTNGWLPNYGANDGALFFPLSNADYRDYRPQLDALHGLLTGMPLYDNFIEDAQWLSVKMPTTRKLYSKLKKQYGVVKFEKSGYYLIREKDTLSFIRCGLFKTNGSTDQLHLDVWYKGKNVLTDGGSYMYNNPDEKEKLYFMGTESHNTIMLGEYNQMQKGPRFMWFSPPRLIQTTVKETENSYIIEGKINTFRYVNNDIVVIRTVSKEKGSAHWMVQDYVENKPENVTMRQLWHTEKTEDSMVFSSDGHRKECSRWHSAYYGVKTVCTQIEFQTEENKINTNIIIK